MTSSDPELAARGELIARLEAVPGRLGDVARRAQDRGTTGDDWPVWKIALHLEVVEAEVWQVRLREMTETDNPRWTWTEPTLDGRDDGRSLDQLLRAFAAERRVTVGCLANLDDADWRRVGTHAVFGNLDVAGLVREALTHDDEHLLELERRAGHRSEPA